MIGVCAHPSSSVVVLVDCVCGYLGASVVI